MTLLTASAAATFYMTGVGCIVQFVAYPLFSRVGPVEFVEYHAGWTARITPVVFLPMTIELLTAAALVVHPPSGSSAGLAAVGLVAAATTWLSTVFLQVPAHNRLASGFDKRAHTTLVKSSWVRTIGWVCHSAVICLMLAAA